MSFIEKVIANKQAIIAIVGGLATGYLLYKIIGGKPKEETALERRKREVEILKREINVQLPSFEDVKKVLTFALAETRIKVNEFSREFKEKRMKFTKETRKQNIHQYLILLSQGLATLELIAIQQQQKFLKEIGMNSIHIQKHRFLLANTVKQIITDQNKNNIKPMKLQQVKFAIRRQIQFIKEEGLEYAQLIIDNTREWSNERRARLPMILSLIVNDCAFEGYPQIDEEAVQFAEEQHQKQLMGQLQQLQIAITPMMIRLNFVMKEISGFDFSDLSFGSGFGYSPKQLFELRNFENGGHSVSDIAQKVLQ